MGQGLQFLSCLRRGRSLFHAEGIPQIETPQGVDLQYVFQKSDFRDTAPYPGPSAIYICDLHFLSCLMDFEAGSVL